MGTLCKQFVDVSRALCADLDTPVSLGVSLRVKYGEWDQLVSMKADPRHYLDTVGGTEKFFRDYQAVELLRKCDGLPTSIDTKAVALQGFYEAEAKCFETNLRLDRLIRNYGLTPGEFRILPIVDRIQKLIKRVLGPLPDDIDFRFGPGATFESKGHPYAATLTVADKMSMLPCCTSSARFVLTMLAERTAWFRALVEDMGHCSPVVTEGNRFTTVPKDATKDRGICIEPGGNVFLQLGVGRFIRRRLKLFGIDLTTGQDLHCALAQSGSLSGEIATIDLSSASDTVAIKLVKLLLPEEWFELLFSLRAEKTLVDGKWFYLEKFSSMGNGFTFELETLIFGAIAAVVSGGRLGIDVFAYGDDLIVPSASGSEVVHALRYFGMIPNERKTFLSGPFRESCGGDFFDGRGVTPYRVKEVPNDPASWIAVANGLWARAKFSHVFRRARLRALGSLPGDIRRLRGPEQLGDLVIHDRLPLWQTVTRSSIRYVRVWRPVSRRVRLSNFSPAVQMATALYGSAEGEKSNFLARLLSGRPDETRAIISPAYLTPRNSVSGYRKGYVAFS